uniref:Uncharacterized protein n=1 Tax=Rhizophora mucronata TaxID=61149 RepID=A0A2P2P9Y3_RHIMU
MLGFLVKLLEFKLEWGLIWRSCRLFKL